MNRVRNFGSNSQHLGQISAFIVLAMLSSHVVAQTPQRLELTRMMAHWAHYADEDYVPFVEAAEPELVQLGFYGAHFWSLAHTPQYKGYPAHFPVQGLNECRQWFRERNLAIQDRGIKVVGHFNVEFLVGDPDGPEGPRGFFHFYRNLWDEQQLGPRPVDDPIDLLERDADSKPRVNQSYSIGGMKEYWACLRNPHWQRILKAWVKQGVDMGLDGFIVNYFYRHNCLCEHCRSGFREYLANRFTAQQMQDQFGIDDLAQHKFDEIVCWHDPEESTALRREMLRWSQLSNKQVFDEVFVRYGRTLKQDLIVAQWNHLSNFSQIKGDERCLLPADQWGKNEDYLWYSTGASANYTDLANNDFGDATLQARYIRGAFDDKPFTLGKYESTRIRSAIAELAANGGAPMGFYTRFTDPIARQTIIQYYQFLKRYDEVFRANRPYSEVLLMFPRSAVHQGDVDAVDRFRKVGKKLLDEHVLFDVLPDDLCDEQARAPYAAVLSVDNTELRAQTLPSLSRFTAPAAVRVSASQPAKGNDFALHFVNYNRDEPPKRNGRPNPGGGAVAERPIAVDGIGVQFVLPEQVDVVSVEVVSPENPDPQQIHFTVTDGILNFELPRMLVYAIAKIQTREPPDSKKR